MRKNNKWFLSVPLALILAAAPGFAKAHVTDSQVVGEIQDHLYHARIYKQGDVRGLWTTWGPSSTPSARRAR